ncbi:hypothetical protein [Marinicella meishanensis]|uniref:hypothetical protein n=1 Tax=Marinicella meishanensis TaxID=2873263 RepID=UPI001CBF09E3|nr:hypothetical protein [Marinicella sp. NBU2979]
MDVDLQIDYRQYQDQQLIDALAAVDDEQHPEQAMTIYRILLERHKWHHSTVDAKRLGYSNGWFLDMIHQGWLQMFYLGNLLDELYMENHAMAEKLERLNAQLSAEDMLTKCK